jgi:copper chaperone
MTLELTISDMACSVCVDAITQAVLAIDPKAQVEADTTTKQVTITTTPGNTSASEQDVKQAIAAAGYTIA